MKYNNIKIALLACSIVITTSCSIDNIKPINQLTENNVITNEVSANSVLNRIYNLNRNFFISNMAASTGFYGIEQDEAGGTGSGAFYTNNVQDDSGLLNSFYKHHYRIINEANFFIKLIEAGKAVGLKETRKKAMLAEARFFRAMSHFSLLRVFGEFYDTSSQYGVVVSLTPISGNNAKTPIARSTVKDSYKAIIDDLKYATANAGTSKRGRIYISATTAKGLLAKVQLYSGDYPNAAINALAVINNTDGYKLEPAFADIFKKRWLSSEVLFAPYVDGLNERDAYTATYFSARVSTPSKFFKGFADASDGVNDDAVDVGGFPSKGYDPRFLYTYSKATRGIYSNGKYPFRSTSPTGGAGNTFYYLRMAEVYLIYAEAEARRTGGVLADALKKLNDVRKRAGATLPLKTLSDKATLLKDIRADKMIELCTENAEPYYDLVRYDKLGELSASSFKATLTDNKFIFPIPVAALAGNSLLKPNPNK